MVMVGVDDSIMQVDLVIQVVSVCPRVGGRLALLYINQMERVNDIVMVTAPRTLSYCHYHYYYCILNCFTMTATHQCLKCQKRTWGHSSSGKARWV